MFLTLARWFQEQDAASTKDQLERSAAKVFKLHPLVLARALQEAYFARDERTARGAFPNPALPLSVLSDVPSGLANDLVNVPDDIYPLTGGGQLFLWHHLVYAFLVEQTGVFEIFARVLDEYLHGEKLEVPSATGQSWLRATEDLLYRDAPSGQISAVTSWIRGDIRATRRNAYWRLFGLDLDHDKDGIRGPGRPPYPYEKAQVYNVEFKNRFEDFARQVWLGIENVVNTSGAKTTNNDEIAYHARDMFDMLTTRRRLGNLAREEFVFVAMMSWLHLTLLFDSPIVVDLKGEASSPEQRLEKTRS